MPSSQASQRSYSLVEPHPEALPRSYIATGRGGAGNITRAPSNLTKGATAQGPPSRIHLSSISSASSSSSSASSRAANSYRTGRGGAGNVHPATERAIFSFDEELERLMSQERRAAPVYHVGRGGAGNVTAGVVQAYPAATLFHGESEMDDRRSTKSASSVESGADVATRAMKKGLRKVWGGH